MSSNHWGPDSHRCTHLHSGPPTDGSEHGITVRTGKDGQKVYSLQWRGADEEAERERLAKPESR